MKSKNIPVDIKSKSINEAQKEIKNIIENLENSDTDLKKSINQYNRMIQLNYHIQDLFRKKLNNIKDFTSDKTEQSLKRD